jgi:hypothetical protein
MHETTVQTFSGFQQFWFIDGLRDQVLADLNGNDLAACRSVCRAWSRQATPFLFKDLKIDFKSNTLSKPSRMEALDRIGHYARTLTFSMPHGPHTFLPPLLDQLTGEEIDFIYEPDVGLRRPGAERLSIPKYGSWEMTDLLVKQYPPLFHAATNVPAFIRTLTAMPNLQHIKVTTPGQENAQRYRRNIIDYALISLRIAIERSPIKQLEQLSLLEVHPAAVQYLNPVMGLGARPDAFRRWRQIKGLTIHMDTIPHGEKQRTDHLKLLHSYLQVFAPSLERLVFHWKGSKGLFPLALSAEHCLSPSSPAQACPKRCHLALRPLKFQKLIFMEVDNVTTDAVQVSTFILAHRRSISEFNFEGTTLRDGTWDDALAPLTRLSGSDKWKKKRRAEVMDVPLMLSPLDVPMPGLPKPEVVLPPRCMTPLISTFGFEQVKSKSRGLFSLHTEHVRRFFKESVAALRQF